MFRQLALGRLNLLILLNFLAHYVAPVTAKLQRPLKQFEQFFPAWEGEIKAALQNETCQHEFETYDTIGYAVITCILNKFPEFRKAELAASSVILGLAPALLQQLSPTPADIAVLWLRRPFLAIMLAASTSAVRPLQASEYGEYLQKLNLKFPFDREIKKTPRNWVLEILMYLIVCAAVANNAFLAYQLGIWAVCTWAPDTTFLPSIAASSCLFIHLIGYLLLYHLAMRKKREESQSKAATSPSIPANKFPTGPDLEQANSTKEQATRSSGNKTSTGGTVSPTPSASGTRTGMSKEPTKAPFNKFHPKQTTYEWVFLIGTTALYLGSIVQVVFSTAVFSSLVFLSVRDSAVVVVRYLASTLVCRGFLFFQLNWSEVDDADDAEGKSEQPLNKWVNVSGRADTEVWIRCWRSTGRGPSLDAEQHEQPGVDI